jgi:hypothetical protein
MNQTLKRTLAGLMAAVFTLATSQLRAAPPDHVVSPAEIQQSVSAAAKVRQQNVEIVENFLESPEAQKALKKSKINVAQVEKAIPTLSNQELAQLARRASTAQNDFAAGALNNEQLTYIVIAIATAVVVILIVKA